MKIVIEISERAYEAIKEHGMRDIWGIGEAIANGTPLPKGHGRIGDFDIAEEWLEDGYMLDDVPCTFGSRQGRSRRWN